MNMSGRFAKSVTLCLLTTSLAAGPGALWAADSAFDTNWATDPGAAMLADVAAVRPLSLVASALGIGVWVVGLPFSLPGGNPGEAAGELMGKPLEYTFSRPVGTWHECGPDRHKC